MTATEDSTMDHVSSSFQDMNVDGCSPSKSPFLLKFPHDIARENQNDEVAATARMNNHRRKPLLISRRANKQYNDLRCNIFANSINVPPPPPPMSSTDGGAMSSTARSSPPKQFLLDGLADEANLSFNEESYITPVIQTNRKMYNTGPTHTPHLPCLSELNRHTNNTNTNERREGRNDFNLSEMREAVRAAESAVSAPRLMLRQRTRRANRVKSSRPDLVGL